MPNIEIHGFDKFDKSRTFKIRNTICEGMKDETFGNDVVVTIYQTRCRTLAGKKAPFLRVLYIKGDHIDQIINFLHEAFPDLDIECQKLTRFIESES